MIKKKGKNRKTKNLYKNAYTTVLSWMNLYCPSLDYYDISTISGKNDAL